MFRLPNPGKEVVLVQHGLLCSSADWLVLGPGKSLPYLLWDAGYDVFLGMNILRKEINSTEE